jgi:excisionase family DNA binding protein
MMGRVKTLTEAGGGDLLSLLDARMKRIAAETFRELAVAPDVGAVKVKTAARLLDMTEHRVRQMIREGRLRAVNPTPHTVRVPLAEIRRFQEGEQ